MCYQFSVYVFADIDLRGFKVEAVEFLLQPFFITLNDFEDVGVNLAVCNQWIAQAFVAVLNDGELAVLFHHGTFDSRDFVDAGGAEFEHEVVCADAVFHAFIGLDFAVDDNPDGFAVNDGFDPAVVVFDLSLIHI